MSKPNAKELKNDVRNFRLNELRSLLSFAKRNNNGKKSELLERVYEIIDNNCTTSLAFKIYEISAKRVSVKSNPLQKKQSPDTGVKISEQSKPSASASTKSDGHKNRNATKGINGISLPGGSKDCSTVNNTEEFVDTKLATLPFYEQLEVLVKPTCLKNQSNSFSSLNYAKFNFQLSSQQANTIRDFQELVNDCMIEYKVQILIRFWANVSSSEQEDNLPSMLCLSVNGKAIALPVPPTPQASIESKRPGRPLDITHTCHLLTGSSNTIDISWGKQFSSTYCFTVVLSKKLNCSDLLQKLEKNSFQNPEHTKALIKEKLSAGDAEISATSLKIFLICPLGKVRVTTPVRSSVCSHLQCFDATTFLQMNEKKPTWICPICDKPAKFETLIIDGLFTDILSKVNNSNEIQFFEDGSWKPLTCKREVWSSFDDSIVCLDAPDSPYSSSSADTIVFGGNAKESSKKKSKSSTTAHKNKLPPVTMIDLTGDSDEDDEDDDDDDDDALSLMDGIPDLRF